MCPLINDYERLEEIEQYPLREDDPEMRKYRYFVGDFETTVYDGQLFTEVWASALVEMNTNEVIVDNCIEDTFERLCNIKGNVMVYYHNLKFDGHFWLDYFERYGVLKKAGPDKIVYPEEFSYSDPDDMPNGTYTTSISSMGQWYRILIKIKNKFIEIRDSLKLLPFSVANIGKSFGTNHKKGTLDYKGFRKAHGLISESEKEYISNDVLVVKEALEFMFRQGHDKMTIGSCCLAEYKKIIGGKKNFDYQFPDLYQIPLDKEVFGVDNAGDYIRKSYAGGWCYINPKRANQVIKNGCTADVNSLYPSVMSSESGSRYPIGLPIFWRGDFIPEVALQPDKYYFVTIETEFELKGGYLPTIQIKGSPLYKSTEWLTTSLIRRKDGSYTDRYLDTDGHIKKCKIIRTMTMTDWELFKEHYRHKTKILHGCFFRAEVGIFDDYINKYRDLKVNAPNAEVRTLAKLFLNNLYGKMASNTISSYKVPFIKDNVLNFFTKTEFEKTPGYIPVGSAVTSYARNFTIRTAQKNYEHFIYADTDSIHADCPPDELIGVPIHDSAFCHWKIECKWEIGLFVRQKTYIEIANGKTDIKCAGMPDKCKQLFLKSISQDYDPNNYSKEELEFLSKKREITDFKVGLIVPGKLVPKRMPGGIVLIDTTYELH